MTLLAITASWLIASVIAAPLIGRHLATAGCPCGSHQ